MPNPLAGHTNSYHTYGHDEALAGIAAAGYRYVELSAVPGWTEHVDLDADRPRSAGKLEGYGLEAVSLCGALRPDDAPTGSSTGSRRCAGRPSTASRSSTPRSAATSRADENEAAFLANIGAMADAADAAGVVVALEIHGDIMASSDVTIPLLEKIGRDSVRVNYDTANVEFYSGDKAVDDLPKITPYLAHVHLKDTTGGKGNWNFPRDRRRHRRLRAACSRSCATPGTTGPYSVEIEFEGEPWPPLADVNDAMRRSYEHLSSLGLS